MGGNGGQNPQSPVLFPMQNAKGEMVLLEDDYVAPQKPPRYVLYHTVFGTLANCVHDDNNSARFDAKSIRRVKKPCSLLDSFLKLTNYL